MNGAPHPRPRRRAILVISTALVPLALYSAWLVAAEAGGGQGAVRPYFTDIEGPVFLFAVNTTLSVALLWTAAILCAVAAAALRPAARARRALYLSQAAVFAFVSFDDRFMVHERLHTWSGLSDGAIFAIYGTIEAALLFALLGRARLSAIQLALIAAAGALFCLATAIDAFGAQDGALRLSAEDLAKVWSSAALAAFGWVSVRREIAGLRRGAPAVMRERPTPAAGPLSRRAALPRTRT